MAIEILKRMAREVGGVYRYTVIAALSNNSVSTVYSNKHDRIEADAECVEKLEVIEGNLSNGE